MNVVGICITMNARRFGWWVKNKKASLMTIFIIWILCRKMRSSTWKRWSCSLFGCSASRLPSLLLERALKASSSPTSFRPGLLETKAGLNRKWFPKILHSLQWFLGTYTHIFAASPPASCSVFFVLSDIPRACTDDDVFLSVFFSMKTIDDFWVFLRGSTIKILSEDLYTTIGDDFAQGRDANFLYGMRQLEHFLDVTF